MVDLPIQLSARRYNVLDSIGIAFRCNPLAAFFYGFFDLAWAVLTPLATLVAAHLIDAVVSAAGGSGQIEEVYTQLALLAGITAFGWLRSAMHNFSDLRLVLSLRHRYRTALTEKRTRLKYGLLEQSETWDLIERVAANPEGGRLKATYFHLTDLASFIIKVAGLLIILASAVWWAPLIVLALAGLALTAGINGGKTIYRAEQEAAKHDRNTAYLGDVILGRDAAAERTLFGSSDFITGMWRQSFKQGLRIRFRARIKWYLNAYAGNITNLLIWLILMLLLLVPLQEGTVSIGLFLALTQAFTRFDIVWGFMDTVNGLAADAEFFKELSSFLSLPEENGGRNTISPAPEKRDGESSKTIPASAGSPARLKLRNVRFRYPGTERWILDGLDMVLEPGKRYALVGANGCGKTTVTRLITGLYPVEAGTILLNGREISEYDPAELGYQFSIVYQDFARYGLSLHDNIFLGLDAIGDDTITPREIFAKAGLEALVDRLPMGADTPLGKFVPGGVDISGGEWQRVAMARTLARPSALRILDEPTAALDPVAESELYASFERLTEGTTTLLITHRLGATKTADVILVLDGGRIIETGSHKDLMRAEGLYSRMYESQRYWYEAN